MEQKEIIEQTYQEQEVVEVFDENRHKFAYQNYKHDFESAIVLSQIKRLSGKPKVLDVACGTGRMFRSIMTQDIEYHGIDTSNEMMSHLKESARNVGVPIKLQTGDATRLPYKTDTFDITFTMHLTWHLPQDLQIKMIEEMYRVTKPGGVIIFDILNDKFMWESIKRKFFPKKVLHDIYKMDPKIINNKMKGTPFVIEKLNDFPIKNDYFYGAANIINSMRKILPRNLFHMLYYVVEVR